MSTISTMPQLHAPAQKIAALLEKLPPSKVQELLDFGDFLISRLPSSKQKEKLGDRFAGVWEDDRSAEEIINDIKNSRLDQVEREKL